MTPKGLSGNQDQLREYLRVVRRRKWTVALTTLVLVGIALPLSYQQDPSYTAEATVLVEPLRSSSESDSNASLNMETEEELAVSPAVTRIARESLGSTGDALLIQDLSVDAAADTEILIFRFSHTDPATAQKGAQAFADAYLDFRRTKAIDDQLERAEPLQERYDTLRRRLTRLDAQLTGARESGVGGLDDPTTLKAEVETLVGQIAVAEQELSDIVALDPQPGDVIGEASLPSSVTGPNPLLSTILALITGFGLGVALALLRERLDDRLLSQEDLESALGAPVLAVVPRNPIWRKRRRKVATLAEHHSPVSEAFGQLRTALLIDIARRNAKVILVTSSEAGEGKTTTVANLGVSLAKAGKKVIVVSADLRRPSLHTYFGIQQKAGLLGVLRKELSALEALTPVGVDNLRLLASGGAAGNPAELLGSEGMRTILQELSQNADLVLVDAAPILSVADAVALTPFVDAVLFVADGRNARRTAIEHARKQLQQIDASILGAVLNNVSPTDLISHAYYFPYEYLMQGSQRETGRFGRETSRKKRSSGSS